MKNIFKHSAAVLVGLVMVVPVIAQEAPDPFAGSWEGRLTVPGASLRLVFHFNASDDGSYSGTMDSPDQGAAGIPLGTVTVDGDNIVAGVPAAAGEYSGTLTDGLLAGTWSQSGQTFPLELTKQEEDEETEQTPATLPDTDVQGSWIGTLMAPAGVQLRVVFNLTKTEAGSLTGTLDSPDQGANGIPLGEISGSGESITINVPSVGGTFEGTILPDGSAIDGTWNQAGAAMPLRLTPADEQSLRMPERPQEPKPPYPYREENLTFDNPDAGIQLAGTLTLPEGNGPFPAAILIGGSGPQNRNEELLGHKPFLVLADHLTREGIAVLRYDDRGIGGSAGDFATATSEDFAADATAALDYLQSRPEVDGSRIGLIGHSEGALIAPIVAAERPDLGYIVLMAGPGVTGAEIIYEQAALIARAMGASDEQIAANVAMQRNMFEIVTADVTLDEARVRLRAYLKDRLDNMTEQERAAAGFSEERIELQVQQVASPWMRFFLSYDPVPVLEKVTCPTLAINGEKDLQVAPYQNLPEIERALKNAGNPNFRVAELDGLNHLFQTAETGAPSEYAGIEETFSPKALKLISDWILDHAI